MAAGRRMLWLGLAAALVLGAASARGDEPEEPRRISISERNPFYWQYQGRDTVLLGGSVQDNLFQIPDLREHLDLLASVGGNYVRCTMSSRDEGNLYPFERDPETGLYDLRRPAEEYWSRFERFLRLCQEQDIVVQVEIWATFDHYRGPWSRNPFNPKNNVNYTAEESGLPEAVDTHPTRTDNPFFFTVPEEDDNQVVLPHQRAFVQKLLSISLPFPNVLYCMDNETSVTPEWGHYWARFVRAEAERAGVEVHTTQMWDKWDLDHPQHAHTFDNPDIYSFVEVSQNNHRRGQRHWNQFQDARQRILDSEILRPMNNTKIYGAGEHRFGSDQDAQERFWRNIVGGAASSRFHRPNAGLGLSEKAQANIRSMRMMLEAFDIIGAEPANDLLRDREPNAAYASAIRGEQCAVYFPDGASVGLDAADMEGPVRVKWLDIANSRWAEEQTVQGGETVRLDPPGQGQWAAVLLPADP